MTEPRLSRVALRVRDSVASAAFYREAFGVALESDVRPRLPRDGAQVELALVSGDPELTENAELSFLVDNVEAAHARAVAAGAEIVRGPRADGGSRRAVYRDPDGNVVTLTERLRTLRVAGVDLAGGGLAVVVLEGDRVVETFRCEAFAEALLVDAVVVAVDVPIGISEQGVRPADEAARRFVGPGVSSIVSTPTRQVEARSYEVDEYAQEDERVIEVHPEVSFRELAHRPLLSKHRTDGLMQRRALLEAAGIEVPASVPRIAEPHLLDATVAAWSARRYALGEALPLPRNPTARIGAIWR